MKNFLRTLFGSAIAVAALLSTACQNPQVDVDRPIDVVISSVEPSVNAVAFNIKAEGAISFAYICVEQGTKLTGEQIIEEGKVIVGNEGVGSWNELTPDTSYTILAVSSNGKALSNIASADFKTTEAVNATATAVVKEGTMSVSSVTIGLTVNGCESFAYKIVEGETDEDIIPEIIYAEAEEGSGITEITASAMELLLDGLNGNTAYTIQIALKTADGFDFTDKYITTSVKFTTEGYKQILTIVDIDKFSVKAHVEVPATTQYRYAIVNCETYWAMIDDFGHADPDFLTYGAGMAKGPKDFYWYDGGPLVPGSTDDDDIVTIKPGTAFVVLIGECDEKGNVLFENASGEEPPILAAPSLADGKRLGNYCEQSDQEGITYKGLYAKQFLWTNAPDIAKGKIAVEITRLTERSISFTITPDESILRYGVVMLDMGQWNDCEKWVGADGMQALCLANSEGFTGQQKLSIDNFMEPDMEYRLIVTGQETKDGSVQASTTVDFKPKVSTLPVPQIEITPIQDPAGSPYKVWYNVKCTNKNCAYITYLCNYIPEWSSVLRSGVTYESMLGQFGARVSDADIMAYINSDKGLDMEFSSWENSESRLVLEACNSDEKGVVYTGSSWSCEEPDKEPVASDLFTELLGDWTVTFKTSKDTYNYDVTIADAPEQGPATIADMTKADYDNIYWYFYNLAERNKLDETECDAYAKECLNKLFAEYKEEAAHYARKYRGQNRLVIRGCGLLESKSPYQSPWMLFCNTTYSAYSTEELFLDYGSKLFLEVSKDENGNDRLTLETNPAFIPLMIGWSSYEYFWWGSCTVDGYASKYYADSFDVEVSADKKTLSMKAAMNDGLRFDPSIVMSYGSGIYVTYFASIEDVVFTKKEAAPASVKANAVQSKKAKADFVNGKGHRFMRTRLFEVPENDIPETVYEGRTTIGKFKYAPKN